MDEVQVIINQQFGNKKRIVSVIPGFKPLANNSGLSDSGPHSFENVELAIFQSSLAVAENSAIWLTEETTAHRVLPFIAQHLAIIIRKNHIVSHMHHAYQIIGNAGYGYGVFIAGPSKTADIEQSLVLGAHGPRSLTVFLLQDETDSMEEK